MTHKTPTNTPSSKRSCPTELPTKPSSQFFPDPELHPIAYRQAITFRRRWLAAILAVIAITAIELTALLHGINGTALAAACAAIGAIGGAALKK